jgi:citrate synthase
VNRTAKYLFNGVEHDLPMIVGSEDEQAPDITSFRIKTGLITLDPGFANTGSCQSAITFIDGEKGVMRYRGIPVEAFIDKPNFVEVCWLLFFGSLPKPEAYKRFSRILMGNTNIDEDMKHHFGGFPRSVPPIAMLSAMMS